ncbi:MAG: glycosyltransferase [Proteobacteria bacterium]|nr:glycosyltransferase [Pseudomonadota bacterium]
MARLSVIVGTYNYLKYLKLVLYSLERQSFRDFEVIVADDGSDAEVGEWLSGYSPSYPIKHLWQEDCGFRKCRILNRAVATATGEYIVFIDADCIVARDFLAVHWGARKPGTFLGGRRVMMNRAVSEAVTKEMIAAGRFDGLSLWGVWQSLLGRTKYYEECLRLLGRVRGETPFSLLGSNFSLHKRDIMSVNGFDEEYESRGGGEDTDIALRLRVAGVKMASVRYLALEFHLGHEIVEAKSKSAKLFKKKEGAIKGPADAKNVKSSLAAVKQKGRK